MNCSALSRMWNNLAPATPARPDTATMSPTKRWVEGGRLPPASSLRTFARAKRVAITKSQRHEHPERRNGRAPLRAEQRVGQIREIGIGHLPRALPSELL